MGINRNHTNNKNKGFTMVELVVVLVIMGIILAIAIPSFIHYWRMAEFRKNEENAKTVYLAAESKMTYYRSSGQWKEIKQQILAQGKEAPFDDSKLKGRIYGITLDAGEYDEDGAKDSLVTKIIDEYMYDKSIYDGSIAIEIDIQTGEVYSAFYATKCEKLDYADNDTNSSLTMNKRSYDERKPRLLGYYSTKDTGNVVELDPKRLRITTISLINGETLSLDWSSNAPVSSQDVDYELTFYKDNGSAEDKKLFSATFSPKAMIDDTVSLKVKNENGKDAGTWNFPVTYKDNKFSFVLDGMMSADAQAVLEAKSGDTDLLRTSSTSITRLATLGGKVTGLDDPEDIYAEVRAVPNNSGKSGVEYRTSEKATSNTSNSMFATTSSGQNEIAAFRHLSNIRYYDKSADTTFTVTSRDMNWKSVGTGVYDLKKTREGSEELLKLSWTENTDEKAIDFPTIEELPSNYTLTGKSSATTISNVVLGEDSIVDDATKSYDEYIGLFGEANGDIKNLTIEDPTLTLANQDKALSGYNSLKGVGILAGRSSGNISNVKIETATSSHVIVNANLSNQTTAAIGGLVGSYAEADGSKIVSKKVEEVSVEGKITAKIKESDMEASNSQIGIGGLVGYAYLDNNNGNSNFNNCTNHADVEGNQATGGIVGTLIGSKEQNIENIADHACIKNSDNNGLITSSEENGTCFGGIVGYGDKALIHKCSAASGRASSFVYNSNKKNLLKGTYVGGIIGYGKKSLLNDCSTKRNGYVLGKKYVGGIAGAMEGNMASSITAAEIKVTTNAGYVVGDTYVGGIVGRNKENSTIKDCVNNGVAAGYDKYVGGIAGSNETDCAIEDCASYLSDYSGSIYSMIVNLWETSADYSGGITGYNNGNINFNDKSEKMTVKSVSSIVVGKNYVGGIVGYNDTKGTLDVHYTLNGGRIYASGNCAGGAFGLNASESTLEKELTIKPRSVQGKYYVGGIIGANVVNLTSDTTIDEYKADNILGTITGEAYVGGIIGYHRSVGTDVSKSEISSYLPSINMTSYTPGNVKQSDNSHTLTLTTKDNKNLGSNTNNIPIRAYLYAGGIVGYAEENSKLVIKNCKNAGNVSSAEGIISSNLKGKEVSLKKFISSELTSSKAKTVSDASDVGLHMAGGIISVNLNEQIIDHCANRGSLSGFSGIGGIVGLNAGGIFNCKLTDHFGNATLNYVGGIVGINAGGNGSGTYEDINKKTHSGYKFGTIEDCSTDSNHTISGHIGVGGIVGWNYGGGVLENNVSKANIRAYANLVSNETENGQYIGGVAGRNTGTITVANDSNKTTRSVAAANCDDVGGIVGCNESAGILKLEGNKEIVAVESGVTVTGASNVGGIVGRNHGNLGGTSSYYLVSHAKRVQASEGIVGGIVGTSSGNIQYVKNHATVVANKGRAGGITALNGENRTINHAMNDGNVSSSKGHAGGIVAENNGTISNSSVEKAEIYSLGEDEIGAIAAVNGKNGIITSSKAKADVELKGSAMIFGGIVGKNRGTVKKLEIDSMPKVDSSSSSKLTVGGIVGRNEGIIDTVTAGRQTGTSIKYIEFLNFKNYQYLGIIAGENGTGSNSEAKIINSDSCGLIGKQKIEESGRTKASKLDGASTGASYGGISGINWSDASIEDCKVQSIVIEITGVYTATSTSTADKKERLSTHIGGVVGKNAGNIKSCTLEAKQNSKGYVDTELCADSGMVGGIAGYNKGTIEMSGETDTSKVITVDAKKETNSATLHSNARNIGIKPDTDFYEPNGGNIYDWWSKAIRNARFYIDTNGNIGGITAYNSPTGKVNQCMSGKWIVSNKSNTLGVGTGGIIGMNESQNDSTYLFNRAFVERQISSEQTNRFAGGIIGNQNNSTTMGWNIAHCINYGGVYCYRTHYSGGIIGQWTGNGGNIEDCRNYGNLFTTLGRSWIGASGGIVAQLYHANEDNEYNIIGCRNYGSIYGRKIYKSSDKEDVSGCANDSAGILGNITTYESKNEKNGTKFKVQVLDCINESGVVIQSASMASGIVGFLSSDNPSQSVIEKSIQNIELRIERCQNYATELRGKQFVGGIFGDRYGKTGCQKTVVKDCYSVNSSNYNKQGFPIYSFKNGAGKAEDIEAENRIHNYVGNQVSFTNLKLTRNMEGEGKGVVQTNNVGGNGNFGGTNQYAKYWYIMYDKTKEQYFVATIYEGATVNDQWAYVSENGYIRAIDGEKAFCGQVLFYLDKDKYTSESEILKNGNSLMDYITNSGSDFSEQARESYRRIEGIVEGKLKQPKSVAATINKGKISVNIEADSLPKGERGEKCDPFAYEVYVTSKKHKDGETPSEKEVKESSSNVSKIYTETGEFNIPKGVSGEAHVWVRAVSMYDDVASSKWIEAGTKDIKEILPTPEPRVELVYSNGSYKYRLKLANEDDYKGYHGWQVTMKAGSLGTYTLSESNPTREMMLSSETTCQIVSLASSPDGTYEQSAESSEQVFLPAYRPKITVNNTWWNDSYAKPSFEVSGTNLEDLGIQVTLDASKTGIVESPPIYRAELVGTWKGEENVVFAQTDMLTAAGGKTTANFTNLPEYLRYATNLRIRIWYAESGLGPVYTYWKVDLKTSANIAELESADDDGSNETWKYSYSTVLANELKASDSGKYFNPYIHDEKNEELFKWLTAPALNHADEDGYIVEPTLDESDQKSKYTFTWDQDEAGKDLTGTEDARYTVELTGIIENEDGTEQRVTIDTSDDYKDDTKKVLALEGADWNYSEVELKVTRIGDSAKKEIGLSTTGRYQVKQRLTTPSQPTVELIDTNELNYRVTWDGIDPETGCGSYDLYIREMNDDGTESTTAEKLDTISVADKKNGQYSVEENLEKYTGKEVIIYLVAKAKENSSYIDSADGIGYTFTVPERLPEPEVTWKTNWNYSLSKDDVFTESKFEKGGMEVSLTANNDASVPTSGGGYILKAYIYNSEDDAKQAAKDGNHKNSILEYPSSSDSSGVVEMTTGSTTKEYFHDLDGISIKHAGQWIVFQARLSAGSGNVSSVWTYSGVYQLPYVKLSQPQVDSDKKEYDQEVKVSTNNNPDIPDETETQTWTSTNTILEWDSVKCADTFELNLTGTNGTSDIRLIEDQENKVVEIQKYEELRSRKTGKVLENSDGTVKMAWKTIGETIPKFNNTSEQEKWEKDETRTRTYTIDTFTKEISSQYESDGVTVNYTLTSYTQLEVTPKINDKGKCTGFSYTLKLPDMEKLANTDGRNVMASLSDDDKKAFMPTTQVALTSNVEENLDGSTSKKYVASDPVEVKMK